MKKLLLTSSGLASKNIKNQFLQIINKPVSKIKIIFITAASRSKEELEYSNESKKELIELGIPENNIITLNLDESVSFTDIEEFDVIYVCGGNTFHLLKKVRESGFDKTIIEFVKKGKLYFGISAGSILVNPDISAASTGLEPDENDVNLSDLSGLNLIDVIISPHYCKKEEIILKRFTKKSQYNVITLTDNQALLVNGKEMKIIE